MSHWVRKTTELLVFQGEGYGTVTVRGPRNCVETPHHIMTLPDSNSKGEKVFLFRTLSLLVPKIFYFSIKSIWTETSTSENRRSELTFTVLILLLTHQDEGTRDT